eukprot:m.68521 g.68521  ORF g.68521 m.68521 type:complete len:998 (-) comp23966_c0_seq1:124-3117(-)
MYSSLYVGINHALIFKNRRRGLSCARLVTNISIMISLSWVRILLLTVICMSSSACHFDCTNNSFCGDAPTYTYAEFDIPDFGVQDFVLTPGTNNLTTLDLSGRGIASIEKNGLSCYFTGLHEFDAITLNNNSLTIVPDFSDFGECIVVSLQFNQIQSVPANTFTNFSGAYLYVNLDNNLITSLASASFAFEGFLFIIRLADNLISDIGSVFESFRAYGFCFVELSFNQLTQTDVKTMLSSFKDSAAELTIFANHNNISQVPANLMQNVSLHADYGVYNSITLDFSHNPITFVDSLAFNGTAFLRAVRVNVSSPTAGSIFVPDLFYFEGIHWDPIMGGLLELDFSRTRINLASIVNGLNGENMPLSLTLDLSFNEYTYVPENSCRNSSVTFLNLSHNAITAISSNAFSYNFRIQSLDISYNKMTIIANDFMSSIPGLNTLRASHNYIWALPFTNNNIQTLSGIENNVIVCGSYGPSLGQCTCTGNLTYSPYCNYGRCLPTQSGCSDTEFVNATDCQTAPRSDCLTTCPEEQYYDTHALTCLRITDCATKFRNPQQGFSKAYQVYNATRTSDRGCSICSSCPDGYHATKCTATSNSECNRQVHLSSGDTASIVLTVIMLMVSAVLGVVYGRSQSKKRNMTLGELELTELLLGDVTQEKQRINEERDRMQQAWRIAESDLKRGVVIGRGGNGTVYAGTWGHIPVAIKVLKTLFDDLNPLLTEEFDREVKFMQSIRHPNLLTFYGAGMNKAKQAYLVTELMEGGSLWKLLQDHRRPLNWMERVSFAKDISQGMRYLHDQLTLHRDLKADNCFVDNQLRVKVADFGTGKIQSTVESKARSSNRTSSFGFFDVSSSSAPTLTKGMGSPLWMAPEVLRGDKISEEFGKATDVYSFGIVMFEIWSRSRPWEEIDEYTGMKFLAKLVDLVCDGTRPSLPTGGDVHTRSPPTGYAELMQQCWAMEPDDRPSFAVTLEGLQEITDACGREHEGVKKSASNPTDRQRYS